MFLRYLTAHDIRYDFVRKVSTYAGRLRSLRRTSFLRELATSLSHTHTYVAQRAVLNRAAVTYACSCLLLLAARTRQPLGLGSQPSRANLVTDRFVQDRRASTAEAAEQGKPG